MVFSSPIFLFCFLPVVLTLNFFLPGIRLKNLWLLLGSVLFYAWGEPVFVLLMVISAAVNYAIGLRLSGDSPVAARKWAVAVAIVFNIGLLVVFKYANFLAANGNALLNALGLPTIRLGAIRLPIGISFFTFHAISYILDIYRRSTPAARKVSDAALYIFFFPQSIAGPILRWHDVAHQIQQRVPNLERFCDGIRRFTFGLAKKVLIANTMAKAADQVFSLSPDGLTFVVAWVGVVSYALQIYFDFSGYSDMAIGLGKMFGFEFKENFNYPYISESLREFWRRWHISLSTWFRDYLYIPLGGNRCSPLRNHFNLLLVFFLCGLWHGASWTFVLWGLYHGFFLVIERTRFGSLIAKLPRILRHGYALMAVIIGWTLFRAGTLTEASLLLRAMFGLADKATFLMLEVIHALQLVLGQTVDDSVAGNQTLNLILTNQVIWAGLAGIILSTPFAPWLRQELLRICPGKFQSPARSAAAFGEIVALGFLLIVSTAWLADGTYNPFIYFRF